MKQIPNEAMILSAGYGKRMLPLTNSIPKPLAKINGIPILHHLIRRLKSHNINKIVINSFHLHEVLKKSVFETFSDYVEIIVEKELLETGGGVLNAIEKKVIGSKNTPFYVINGDIFWIQKETISVFEKLYKYWNNKNMDILILLNKKENLFGYEGKGDFNFLENSKHCGIVNKKGLDKKFVFSGVQLINPKIFNNIKNKIFSFNELFNLLIKKQRLFGLVDENEWFHIGTIRHLKETERILKKNALYNL